MLWCTLYQWDAALLTPPLYSYLRQVTLGLHTLPPPCTDDWWRMEQWICPTLQSSTHLPKVQLIWFPGKYAPQQQGINLHLKTVHLKCLMPAIHWKVHLHSECLKMLKPKSSKISFKNQDVKIILDLMSWIFYHLIVMKRNDIQVHKVWGDNRTHLGQIYLGNGGRL